MKDNIEYSSYWLTQEIIKTHFKEKETFYKDISDYAKEYINSLGGFEKFAEWGIQY